MLWVNTTATVLRSAIIVLLIQPHHHASGMDIGRALSRSTSSCVLSFLTVPNLKKAVKQSNGHPNMVEQGAASPPSHCERVTACRRSSSAAVRHAHRARALPDGAGMPFAFACVAGEPRCFPGGRSMAMGRTDRHATRPSPRQGRDI